MTVRLGGGLVVMVAINVWRTSKKMSHEIQKADQTDGHDSYKTLKQDEVF